MKMHSKINAKQLEYFKNHMEPSGWVLEHNDVYMFTYTLFYGFSMHTFLGIGFHEGKWLHGIRTSDDFSIRYHELSNKAMAAISGFHLHVCNIKLLSD